MNESSVKWNRLTITNIQKIIIYCNFITDSSTLVLSSEDSDIK